MEKQSKYDEDLLRIYINPKGIEKAPDDFTAKTMKLVEMESKSLKSYSRQIFGLNVPLVSSLIISLLVVITILVPEKVFNNFNGNVLERLKFEGFKFSLPDYINISLPGWVSWLIAVIFILFLFDIILTRFFHGKENNYPLELNS